MTDRITAAIRADAATSDAEGRRDLAGHLADVRAALLDEAALIAASDRARHARDIATLTATRDIVIGQRETAQRERDEARAASAYLRAEREAWKAEVAELRAERDALRAEVDNLRARPVLTVERLRDALRNERVRFIGHDGRSSLFDHLRADYQADTLASLMATLGAVTLPAQDRAEELARAFVPIWNSLDECRLRLQDYSAAELAAMFESMRRALDKLGAPATTPSKPADVFAGVSIEELVVEYLMSGDPSLDRCVARELVSGVRVAGIRAVLDALRVKLVAPVDPEAFARAYMERVVPGLYDACKSPSLHFSSMRLELEAKGIPVTPEPSKAGSP